MKYAQMILIAVVSAVLPLSADTVVLKDGTKYEGTILSEDGTSYEMRVQVTASIRDVKRIPKDQVESVSKSTPDDEAFEPIKDLLPVPDLQSVTRYDEMIAGEVKPFIKAFPSSKHKTKANEILEALEKERARVARGDIKLDGQWISAKDRASSAFEIDARISYSAMENAAGAGSYRTALRKLEELRRDYMATKYHQKAVELGTRLLKTYRPLVASNLAKVEIETTRRNTEMERLPADQRRAALEEIERQDAAYTALIEREKSELKTRWLTLNTYHRQPMEIVLRNIDITLQQLEQVDTSEQKDAAPVYRSAWAAVEADNKEEAEEHLRELKSMRIPTRYIDELEGRLVAAEEAKVAEAARAEAEQKAAEAAAAREAEMAAAREAPAAGTTGAADSEDSGDEDEERAEASESAPPAPVTEEAAESGGGGTKTILIGVMILVLLVALVAMFAGKKKK